MTSVRIGVDVGGTFTDLVLAHGDRSTLGTCKLLTTPDDPARAIIEGIERLLREADVSAAEVTGVVHGTTLVTNTVIERTGAKVGLITTSGFRDAMEMGREIRYDLYDLFLEPVLSLVPRERRIGVDGRIDAHGDELVPLDEAQVTAAAKRLRDEFAVEAIAVSFIHAYRNPAHEQRALELVNAACPDIPVTLSSAVAPEIREFERTSTACTNAYVQPLMQQYLATLQDRLRELGITSPLHIMSSGGGIATVAQAQAFPVRLLESGPAAGAMAARHYGELLGLPDLISFDMGGTTAKICLIEGGEPRRTHEFEAGRVRRFAKGSGIPLKITVVDMIEIGAGGGSLARVDSMGLLKVGPRSAGAVPGPICYGRGGTDPAVTDADLLLGFLNAEYFLGGEMQLDTNALGNSLEAQVGTTLGLERGAVAAGIHDVVNENMAAATRKYMAEKGRDPRRYSMIAFGGAGPVHAYGLARKLKIGRIVVPPGAGVTSALGFLVAPPAVDDVRSHVARLHALDVEAVKALYADMEADATAQLVDAGADADAIWFTRSVDMRFVGQGFEISVDVPDEFLTNRDTDALKAQFQATYAALFERSPDDVSVETMSWRLHASAPAPELPKVFAAPATSPDARKGERSIDIPGHGQMQAAVFDRYALTPGFEVSGPAIIEEREATTVAGPECTVRVDAFGNLLVELALD